MSYASFKSSVLGKGLTAIQGIKNPYGIECVTLVWAYADYLFPKVPIQTSISIGNAKDIFANASSKYFQKIPNDTRNANQLPQQGDVMVFSETPFPGYTNQFNNPDGHAGICDSANSAGYNLLQQNAPAQSQLVNVTNYPWKFRHCIGWLRPIAQAAPIPAPVPTPKPTAPTPPPTPVAQSPAPPVPPPVTPPTPVSDPPQPQQGTASEQTANIPLPHLVNNVPSPPTPAKQTTASRDSQVSWWEHVIDWITKLFSNKRKG